jgi:Ca2+-binding RTX toxin-like protein
MANITGTNCNDKLTGTAGDDTIKGLGGNDLIRGSNGNDTIDGGAGNDTVDYSGAEFADQSLELFPDSFDGSLSLSAGNKKDKLINIETIIANKPTSEFNSPSLSFGFAFDVDVDLSKNRLTYSALPGGTKKTITVQNFQNISAGGGNSRIKGNDLNNSISIVGSNNTIIGSKGNDYIFGSGGGTFNYSDFGTAVTLSAPLGQENVFISKGGFGNDTITGALKKVIGATNKANTVSVGQFTPLDVNLAKNIVNIGNTDSIEIINFVDAVGATGDDKIVGSNKSGKLTGGGGYDTITGGNSNDIINGTDDRARGVGEVDTLTGGGGRDKFVLGDKNGAYYVGGGANDYALITDFNLFQDSINFGGFKNYSFSLEGKNTIDLYSGKDVNTRDLIAKIQISGGISAVASNAKSVMSTDASLNALVSRIDVVSAV